MNQQYCNKHKFAGHIFLCVCVCVCVRACMFVYVFFVVFFFLFLLFQSHFQHTVRSFSGCLFITIIYVCVCASVIVVCVIHLCKYYRYGYHNHI